MNTGTQWLIPPAFLADESALVHHEWPVALVFGIAFLLMAIYAYPEARQVTAIVIEVTALPPAQRSAALDGLDPKVRARVEALMAELNTSELERSE